MKRTWQETRLLAETLRDKSITQVQPAIPDVPSELPLNVTSLPSSLLSPEECSLTEKSTEDLLSALATSSLSSSTVTLAFLRRAGLAQKLVGGFCSHKASLTIPDELHHGAPPSKST